MTVKGVIQNTFPIPVCFYTLNEPIKKSVNTFIKNLKYKPNELNTSSTDSFVFANEDLNQIKVFVDDCLQDFFKNVYDPYGDVECYITQSWINITKKGEAHHRHVHPNSFISGVFYLEADNKLDKIHFYKEGYQQVQLQIKNFNPYNSTSWWYPVKTGDLVLFPSHFAHSVEPVKVKRRISLSFNTFLKGDLGVESSFTGLKL